MTRPTDIAYDALPAAAAAGGVDGFRLIPLRAATLAMPEAESPHRHDYQEIILVESGTGLHTIDGQASLLRPGTVALIGKGRVHLMLRAEELTGYVVRFTDDFLPPDPGSLELDDRAILFNPLSPGRSLSVPAAESAELGRLLALIETEYFGADLQRRDRALRHLLAVLLLRLGRLQESEVCDGSVAPPEYRVYQDFLLLLEQHFRDQHGAAYYAAALHLGPDRLSRVLRRVVGKTAKQLIAERIVLEAKRYLTYTSLSMKEIAQTLGFRDQFRFSKTFKQQTGLPPQAFREQWLKVT